MGDELPDEMHFEASNRQYIVLGAVSAVFVVLLTATRSIDDVATYDVNIWLTVFFAIVTLIAASAALLKRNWLKLDREGFESSEFKSLGKVAWTEVSRFSLYRPKVGSLPASHQVAFELTSKDKKIKGRLAGLLLTGTIRLTERYRIKGRKLAETMNTYRDNAIKQAGAAR